MRAALVKVAEPSGPSAFDRDLAIRPMVNDTIVPTEVVDILPAAGLSASDISILSEEFLAGIEHMDRKKLALAALRKLFADEIRSPSRSNVIEARKLSERLEKAIARYHASAISPVDVLQDLIAPCPNSARGAQPQRGDKALCRGDRLLQCADQKRERGCGDRK